MEENKELLRRIFEALSTGDSRPFVQALADDAQWKVMGRTKWSRTYSGKATILTDLLGELRARLADRYRATAERILGDGEYVVVQARGDAVTTDGTRYDNEYCFVYRVQNGKITEVTEYLDTALLLSALR